MVETGQSQCRGRTRDREEHSRAGNPKALPAVCGSRHDDEQKAKRESGHNAWICREFYYVKHTFSL